MGSSNRKAKNVKIRGHSLKKNLKKRKNKNKNLNK
tara:strand:+ start:758 stop:862 length:105 start_codon:yes stop_codon:yes gene_type:complete